MPPTDPSVLTSADWLNVHNWLTLLWIFFPLMITFAFSMMIAHAFIPSGVATGYFPSAFRLLRIPLTIIGLIALVLALILFVSALSLTWDLLGQFWPNNFM